MKLGFVTATVLIAIIVLLDQQQFVEARRGRGRGKTRSRVRIATWNYNYLLKLYIPVVNILLTILQVQIGLPITGKYRDPESDQYYNNNNVSN